MAFSMKTFQLQTDPETGRQRLTGEKLIGPLGFGRRYLIAQSQARRGYAQRCNIGQALAYRMFPARGQVQRPSQATVKPGVCRAMGHYLFSAAQGITD